MRVPDADLLGSGAPAPCDHDDLVVLAHNEKRVGEHSSLQPSPIELKPLSLKPELGGELDKPCERKGLRKISGPAGGLDLRTAAILHTQADEA